MKRYKNLGLTLMFLSILLHTPYTKAQQMTEVSSLLNSKEISIISISVFTAKGDLPQLATALGNGLEAGLTVNQIKEMLVHTYAYCGFPRSIRGLQTFMEVLETRKASGIIDTMGAEASLITATAPKYDRGKAILATLTKTQPDGTLTGYSAFAPTIDRFLKEHLFADIFERDVLTYAQRELVTISVISAIGGAEPMLQGHLAISLNTGWSAAQLRAFVGVLKTTIGTQEAAVAGTVLENVLQKQKSK